MNEKRFLLNLRLKMERKQRGLVIQSILLSTILRMILFSISILQEQNKSYSTQMKDFFKNMLFLFSN